MSFLSQLAERLPKPLLLPLPLALVTWGVIAWSNIRSVFEIGAGVCRWSSASTTHRILATAGVLSVGAGLYAIRKRNLGFYATLEVLFGMTVIWVLLGSAGSAQSGAGLLAGLYITLRGVDNIEKAQSKPSV